MPFIYHAKKQSIFDVKQSQITQSKQLDFGNTQNNLNKNQKQYKVNIQICNYHPFRIFHKQRQNNVQLTSDQIITPSKQFHNIRKEIKDMNKKDKTKTKIFNARHQKYHQPFVDEGNQKIQLQICPDNLTCDTIIHQVKDKVQKNQKSNHNQKVQYRSFQRLFRNIQNTPGPGSYQPRKVSNNKSIVIYAQQNRTVPIPPKTQNNLQKIFGSEQNDQKFNQNFSSLCSYKNQSSPVFKRSILQNKKQGKNSRLLNMLFSRNHKIQKSNSKQSQFQTKQNCQNVDQKQAKNPIDTNQGGDQYEKWEARNPSPNSYDMKSCFNEKDLQKSAKYFISGTPKFQNKVYQNRRLPGPGQYTADFIPQKGQSSNLNQNSTMIGPWRQEKQDKYGFGFASGVPRQLHFENENLGKQQFYYSPKNNITDQVNKKINKLSRNYFGSSLERFKDEQTQNGDCYKYSLSKDRYIKVNDSNNCASFKFTGKRQLFDIKKQLNYQNRFQNKSNTIAQQVQKQLFKRLLRSKYQDEKLFLKQKKINMEKILVQDKINKIDIKTTQKQYEQLNSDKYHQTLQRKKRQQKQNISFGSNKESPINRAIRPRQELDVYYQTEPSWNIDSFNKHYGYDFEYY